MVFNPSPKAPASHPLDSPLQGHRIAQILIRIGRTAAIETDEFRFFHQFSNLIESTLARQNAKMSLVPGLFATFLAHECFLSKG
jgi:hypothetical protein